jgi:hypothetical protein
MSPSKLTTRPAKVAAVLLGLAIPLLTVGAHRVPAGTGKLGYDVEISTGGTGELAVDPQGRVALTSGLVPGGPSAAGDVVVRNQTSSRIELAPLVTAPVTGADASVWVGVTRGRRTLAGAPLAQMRDPREPLLALGPGQRARLTLSAWLPRDAPSGWEGRVGHVQVGWRVWIDGKVRR